MHIKDYLIHPKNIEVKIISDERPENFIEDRYKNLQ
jgi:hypothetical protein